MRDTAPAKAHLLGLESLRACYHYLSEVGDQLHNTTEIQRCTERMKLLFELIQTKQAEEQNRLQKIDDDKKADERNQTLDRIAADRFRQTRQLQIAAIAVGALTAIAIAALKFYSDRQLAMIAQSHTSLAPSTTPLSRTTPLLPTQSPTIALPLTATPTLSATAQPTKALGLSPTPTP